VDPTEGREPLTVVPPEVGVKALLGVYAEELADDLDGQHLGVGELRSRTAAAWRLLLPEPIVRQTEHGCDEGIKIHEREPPLQCWLRAPPSVAKVSTFLQPIRKTRTSS
jgi:hypothetical protein